MKFLFATILSTTGLRRWSMPLNLSSSRLSSSAGHLPPDSFTIYMEMAKEILPASADEITTTRVAFGLMAVVTNKENEKALALKDKYSEKALALKERDSEKELAMKEKDSEKELAMKEKDIVTVLALKDKDIAFALEKQRMETISTQVDAFRMMEISTLSQR